jgi:hypothetical protein
MANKDVRDWIDGIKAGLIQDLPVNNDDGT